MAGLVPAIHAAAQPGPLPRHARTPGLVPGIRASMSPLATLALSSRHAQTCATCPDSFRVSGYPAISIGRARRRAVDARNESGHDGVREWPGREASHPETETGFRESLILKRDSPGLSGISGILRASILFEKLPSARPMFPHRAPCARGLTNVMAGLARTCSGYPGIHEALGLASPDHSPVMPGLVPGIFFRQTRRSGRSRGWPERVRA